VVPVLDINDRVVLDHDEFIRPGTTVETLSGLKPSFAVMGEMGGFDAVALQKYHWIERINHVQEHEISLACPTRSRNTRLCQCGHAGLTTPTKILAALLALLPLSVVCRRAIV